MTPLAKTLVLSSLLASSTLFAVSPAHAVASAEMFGRTKYQYGKFEARVQFPAGDGVVGSFFLWKSGSETPAVYWNELDFEKIDECTMHLNNIYGVSDPGTNHNSVPEGAPEACGSFHTYAFEWTPTYIAWFIDGAEVRRDTGEAAQVYVENATEGMIFDFNIWVGNEAFGGTFNPAILPVHEYISYVQYSEYAPGAGDAGSDFSLKWRESFDDGVVPAAFGTGTWPSPFGLTTHNPGNVSVQNGVAILSLTADDAVGFSGTAPTDPMDLPTDLTIGTTDPGTGGAAPGTGGAAPGAGGADGVGAAPGTGGGDTVAAGGSPVDGAGGSGTTPPEEGDDSSGDQGGCSYEPGRRSGSWSLWMMGLLSLAALGFRRARSSS